MTRGTPILGNLHMQSLPICGHPKLWNSVLALCIKTQDTDSLSKYPKHVLYGFLMGSTNNHEYTTKIWPMFHGCSRKPLFKTAGPIAKLVQSQNWSVNLNPPHFKSRTFGNNCNIGCSTGEKKNGSPWWVHPMVQFFQSSNDPWIDQWFIHQWIFRVIFPKWGYP